jgi:dTDP-glucose 4,6-dehydratase
VLNPTTLLTGAGGFVGSHVLESLLNRTDRDVVVTDSFRHNGVFDRLLPVVGHRERIDVVPHDLKAPIPTTGPWREYLRSVDSIVHVASLCQVDMSIRDPEWFITNNILSTLNTLQLARYLDAEFILMSTDEVYGEGNLGIHAPSSPYAASKAAQEDICHAYWVTYGVQVQLIQSCNMFGERQSQLAFIPRIIKSLLDGDPLQVHVDRDGNPGARWYSYVRNVADYVADLLDDDSELHQYRHQLTGQEYLNNEELVNLIGKKMNIQPAYELVEAESVRPGYDRTYASLYENDRWHGNISFEDGLTNTIRWATENPEWLTL